MKQFFTSEERRAKVKQLSDSMTALSNQIKNKGLHKS